MIIGAGKVNAPAAGVDTEQDLIEVQKKLNSKLNK
jgi:CMP-2-keto-3-deoxyoctulosonic acid synthetase